MKTLFKTVFTAAIFACGVQFAAATALINDNLNDSNITQLSFTDVVMEDDGSFSIDFKTVECEMNLGDGRILRTSGGCWLCGTAAAERRCQDNLNRLAQFMEVQEPCICN